MSPATASRSTPVTGLIDRMGPLALALAAVLVVACGALPKPFRPPAPPDALQRGPIPVTEPVPPVPADPAKLGELALHRAVWDSLGISDYTLTLMYGCECDLAGKRVAVTAVGGEIAAATVDGPPLAPAR